MDAGYAARVAAEAAVRRSYGKLVAWLAARTRDVAGAEDALADALAAALAQWPVSGVPDNPEAWLLAVARRRQHDRRRRQATAAAGEDHLRMIGEEMESRPGVEAGAGGLPDERLGLMFACAHPAIEPGIRAPLMLQAVLGFDAAAIASAFLVPPTTMAQRLVRAKARIRHAGIPFRVPDRTELSDRLDAVLAAIYATYAAGWVDPAGTDARRRNLAGEGVWLGRLVAALMPDEPEALGLLALMLFAEARRGARRDASGDYVPLGEQDTDLWDHDMIDEAEATLLAASRLGRVGRCQIEAAIQSVHAARRTTGRTDWAAAAALYRALLALTGSPVAALNHAVAVASAGEPERGLALLDELGRDARMATYQPFFAARADLLARLGRPEAAAEAYRMAIGLESDPAVRRFLQARLAET